MEVGNDANDVLFLTLYNQCPRKSVINFMANESITKKLIVKK